MKSFLWENGIHGLSFLSFFLKIVLRLFCVVLIQFKTNFLNLFSLSMCFIERLLVKLIYWG